MKLTRGLSAKAGCVWLSVVMGIIWSSSTTFSGLGPGFAGGALPYSADAHSDTLNQDPRKVQLAVSLVWDGRPIERFNLVAIREFRRKFSSVPLIHFISPAYFTRGESAAAEAAAQIKEVLRDDDVVGLQLGGWKTFVKATGAIFRNGPTFWGSTVAMDCAPDCGGDIPVHVYPAENLRAFVRHGTELLRQNGFKSPVAINVEGFVSTPHIMAAAADAGIAMDFSAIEPKIVQEAMGEFPISDWVRSLWTQIRAESHPFANPVGGTAITVIPNKIGAVDYHTPQGIQKIFDAYTQQLSDKQTSANHTFTLAMFQSTALHNIPKMVKGLQGIFAASVSQGLRLEPLDLPRSPASMVKRKDPLKEFELPSH